MSKDFNSNVQATNQYPGLSSLPTKVVGADIESAAGGKRIVWAKLSACTDYVALIDENRSMSVFRLSTKESFAVPITGKAVAVALNNGIEFAVASDDGTVQRFDLTNPRICLSRFRAGKVSCLAYDPTSKMLVTGMENGECKLFDLECVCEPELIGVQRLSYCGIQLITIKKDTIVGVNSKGRICVLRNADTKPASTTFGSQGLDLDCWTIGQHPYLSSLLVGGASSYIRHFAMYNLKPTILPSSFPYIRELIFVDFECDSTPKFAAIGSNGYEIWDLVTNSVADVYVHETKRALCARASKDYLKVIWG